VSHVIAPDTDGAAPGAPLGPGSLLWRIASDWRSGLSGLSAGMLQLAWPHLGQGVEEHSAFFTEPWDRIHRSVPQIWATIFADDADGRGRHIRDIHRDIKGTDPHGRRYHALDPDTFWWAHATFTWEMFQTIDQWDHRPLSGRRRERLYQETVTWYRRYGVSDRPVPPDVRSFEARWDHICRHELQLTPTAERAIEMALAAEVAPAGMPEAVAAVATPVMRLLALGGLPRVVRRRFDIPWSPADALAFAGVRKAVRDAGVVVPHRLTREPYLRSIRRMKHIAAPRPEVAAVVS
jgi:uncharacterized protein (DUF2236 family)